MAPFLKSSNVKKTPKSKSTNPKYQTQVSLKQRKTFFKAKFQTRFKARKTEENFTKNTVMYGESSLVLKKTFELSPLLHELLVIKAFVGDFYKKNHRSQEGLIIGYKNKYSFYNIQDTIKLFTKASNFIKEVLKNKSTKLVFVGCPSKAEKSCAFIFRKLNIPFFSNEAWCPGFFSINKSNNGVILVIYNPSINVIALNEALNKNIPVVGFATPKCNIYGLDYPVLLNLENSGLWYSRFWKALLNKN